MPSFAFGGAPPPEVAAYFRDKDLRPAFRWSEVWQEEHAHAFTVAKATQLEVLTAIRGSLQRAIDEGVPFEAWRNGLQPELERLGWWGRRRMTDPATGEDRLVQLGSERRLRTIYEANLRTARAAGQWDRAQRTKAALPFFVYELGPSKEHRPEHEAKEGLVYPVDHPFWDAWFPPNGWGCKCRVRQIGRAEAARRGGASAELDIPERTFTRRRDDGSREVVRVPEGIDPGWGSNPGRARAQGLMDAMARRLERADPGDARAAVQDVLRSSALPVLRAGPARLQMPVAVAPERVMAALRSSRPVISVSNDAIKHILEGHGRQAGQAVEVEHLRRVQAIVDGGETVRLAAAGATLALEIEGEGWWVAAINRSAAGFLHLRTLFRADKARIERYRRQMEKTSGGGSAAPRGSDAGLP